MRSAYLAPQRLRATSSDAMLARQRTSSLREHGERHRSVSVCSPSTTALVLSFVAVALALVTGWLGGELVDRLGVGVDRGAHLDAPELALRTARSRVSALTRNTQGRVTGSLCPFGAAPCRHSQSQ